MKQKQGNRIPLEQQFIQIGTYSGTLLMVTIFFYMKKHSPRSSGNVAYSFAKMRTYGPCRPRC